MVFEHVPVAFPKSYRDSFDGNSRISFLVPRYRFPVQKMRN